MNAYEETVSYRFAAFCWKVLRRSVCKYFEENNRRREREFSLSLLYEEANDRLHMEDEYLGCSYHFNVHGSQVEVQDECLGAAMNRLSVDEQEVLLLYYFLGFKNEEIAQMSGCTMRTVIRRKNKGLASMKKDLEEQYELER